MEDSHEANKHWLYNQAEELSSIYLLPRSLMEKVHIGNKMPDTWPTWWQGNCRSTRSVKWHPFRQQYWNSSMKKRQKMKLKCWWARILVRLDRMIGSHFRSNRLGYRVSTPDTSKTQLKTLLYEASPMTHDIYDIVTCILSRSLYGVSGVVTQWNFYTNVM